MFTSVKKIFNKVSTAVVATVVSASVFADDPATKVDYAALTSKIDFSSAVTAVLGVIALVVGALVAWKGGQWIIKAVRSA